MVSALPGLSQGREASVAPRLPLLEVPPFPGRRFHHFTRLAGSSQQPVILPECLDLLRCKRVGGTYWGRQPELPEAYLLVRSAAAATSCASFRLRERTPEAKSRNAGYLRAYVKGIHALGENGTRIRLFD